MPYDEGHAQILRDALAPFGGVTEKNMFGGLCFLLNGNMICGVHKGGGMFRVGKDNYDAALQVPGTAPLSFTGRPMGGMIDVSEETITDDADRDRLVQLAHEFVGGLPAK